MLISALVTFLVVILILYLINMLPLDGRAKQIARVVVIILGVISLLKSRGVLAAGPQHGHGWRVAWHSLIEMPIPPLWPPGAAR